MFETQQSLGPQAQLREIDMRIHRVFCRKFNSRELLERFFT